MHSAIPKAVSAIQYWQPDIYLQWCNDITEKDIEILEQYMKQYKIDSLVVSNPMTLESVSVFVKILKSDRLRYLRMYNSELEPEAIKIIAQALVSNDSLIELCISNSPFGSEGLIAIAELLQYNTTIRHFIFQNNHIGSRGVQALVSVLKTNQTITMIDLSNNDIGELGFQAITECIRTNTTIRTFYFDDRGNENTSTANTRLIASALRNNYTIVHVRSHADYMDYIWRNRLIEYFYDKHRKKIRVLFQIFQIVRIRKANLLVENENGSANHDHFRLVRIPKVNLLVENENGSANHDHFRLVKHPIHSELFLLYQQLLFMYKREWIQEFKGKGLSFERFSNWRYSN